MPKSNRTPSRRGFLKYSVTASIGLGCMSLGLTEVIAQPRRGRKPLFSEQALNAALRRGGKPNQKNLAAEIRRDPKGWVESHFALTPNQQNRLNSYTAEDFGKIEKILELVESNGGSMSAHFSNTSNMAIGHNDCPNKGSFYVRTPGGSSSAEVVK